MMGFGYYGSGGESSSSSSNLSPLAPPFTVDRSVPKPISTPLMDFSEPSFNAPLNSSLHNWMNNPHSPHSFPEIDANTYPYSSPQTLNLPSAHMPSSNPYASTDAFSYTQSSDGKANNFLEAKPYYPSYVSTAVQPGYDVLPSPNVATFKGSSNDDYTRSLSGLKHTNRWGGLWEGLAGGEQGKQFEHGGSFGSKEMNIAASSVYGNDMDLGANSSKGLNRCEENSHSSDMLTTREKHIESASIGQLDYKSFLERTPYFMPADYFKTSIWDSNSIFPESHPLEPPQKLVDSMINQVPYNGSYEKCMEQHATSPNDGASLMKSVPGAVVAPPAIGTCSSVPNIGSFKNVNSGSNAADINFDSNNPNLKDPSPFPSFGRNVRFDASQLSFHLEGNDHMFAKNFPTGTELPSSRGVRKDTLDSFFEATSDRQGSHIGPDSFSLAPDYEEAIIPAENSSEVLDYYNPPVDSPCWKGAPGSHYSPFEPSTVAPSKLIKKLEGCSGFNIQGPHLFPIYTDDAVKTSFQKLSEDSVSHESRCGENRIALSPRRDSAANLLSRERGSDDIMKVGFNHMKPSCSRVTQFSVNVDEPKKQDSLSNKSINEYDLKPSQTFQQSFEQGRLTSELKYSSGSGVADVGMNANAASDYGSSHGSFHATKSFSSSSSSLSLEDIRAMLHEESPPKMNVQTLVNTMHNMSELLLYHCPNKVCELREQESEALKNVINNLEKCILKIRGEMNPTQESLSAQQATSQSVADLSKHQGASVLSPQVAKIATIDLLGQSDNQHVHEKKKHYVVPGYAEGVKDDKMTQAIKKVLIENFPDEEEMHPQVLLYKNLWLEAEAALCSITHMARFNRMKNEMDKCKLPVSKDLSTDPESPSRAKFSPDPSTVEKSEPITPDFSIQDSSIIGASGHVNDVMAKYHILRCRINNLNSMDTVEMKNLTSTMVSPELDMVDISEPVANGGPTPDFSIQNSSIIGSSGHMNDVMARFHILKSRIDNPNSVNAADAEKLSSSKVSPDMNKIDKLSTEVKDSSNPDMSIKDSPVSSTTIHSNDVEASVTDRFRIQKSRIGNSSSMKGSSTPDMSIQDSPVSNTAIHSDDVESSVVDRFRILKSRADNSSSMDVEQPPPPEVLDLRFGRERMHCPTIENEAEDGSLDLSAPHASQNNRGNYIGDKLTVKEFYLQVKDDPVIQSRTTNMYGNKLSPGFYDSSSSDWEHVLKEELGGQ